MKAQISIEELRTRKIFVATPMYGGQCHGMFTKACVDLGMMASKYGVDIKFFYLFNESLITRARNYLVDEFLRSEYTHLMFIDSDVSFNPNDVLALAALSDPETDICIYLDSAKRCQVYESRPAQCAAFPFWSENLRSDRSWQRTLEECPGLDAEDAVIIDGDTVRLKVLQDRDAMRGFRVWPPQK